MDGVNNRWKTIESKHNLSKGNNLRRKQNKENKLCMERCEG